MKWQERPETNIDLVRLIFHFICWICWTVAEWQWHDSVAHLFFNLSESQLFSNFSCLSSLSRKDNVFFSIPIEIIERSHKFGLTRIYKILLVDQDPAQHGRPSPDHQRVEGRGGEQGGRPVPRRHLLLPQIRPHKWQGKHFTESQRGGHHYVFWIIFFSSCITVSRVASQNPYNCFILSLIT